MTPRRVFCTAIAIVLCTVPLFAQNLALRGSLALTGCTAVDATQSVVYAAYNGTVAVISVEDPDHPALIGQVSSGVAAINSIEAEGNYVYCAGGSSGIAIIDVSTPAEPTVVRLYSLSGANVVAVAARDTLVAVAMPTSVALIGVRDPAHPHLLASYGRAASWIEFQPDSLRLHMGSSTGVFSLRITPATGTLAPAGQYGTTPMSPLACVGPYVDAARGAALTALETADYTTAGERQTDAAVRAVAGIHTSSSDKMFIALANGMVEYLRHQAGSGAPVFVAGATLTAPGNGLAMAQSGTQSLVIASHTNGLSVLVYDAAPVTPQPVAAKPQSLALSAYPNPFNSVAALRMEVPRPGLYQLAIYDLLGREVHSETRLLTGTSTQRMDFSGRAAGSYLVRLAGPESAATVKLLYLP